MKQGRLSSMRFLFLLDVLLALLALLFGCLPVFPVWLLFLSAVHQYMHVFRGPPYFSNFGLLVFATIFFQYFVPRTFGELFRLWYFFISEEFVDIPLWQTFFVLSFLLHSSLSVLASYPSSSWSYCMKFETTWSWYQIFSLAWSSHPTFVAYNFSLHPLSKTQLSCLMICWTITGNVEWSRVLSLSIICSEIVMFLVSIPEPSGLWIGWWFVVQHIEKAHPY